MARLLHDTRAEAVPVRSNGFRDLLLHKQLPGKLFRNGSIRLHRPLPLDAFYAAPHSKQSRAKVLDRLEALIDDPA